MKDYLKDYLHDNKLYIGKYLRLHRSLISGVSHLLSFLHLDPDLARPWTAWYFLNDTYFQKRALISLVVSHAALLGFIIFLFQKPEAEFGDARWATRQDIRKAGLFAKEGLVLERPSYLLSNTPTHVMLIAPTRSGKGVGLVVPNLLNWGDSFICLDLKHENYRITSGYRKSLDHGVFMWAPLDLDGRSHRYNPLDAVSKDPYQRISDLQVIAKILIKDPAKSDPIWASEARALFIGLALYVMDNPKMPSTIGSINRMLGTEQDLGDICRHIVETHHELSPTVTKSLMNFANKAAKERSGVNPPLNQAINLWDNPVIDAATSASDFSIADLRKRRMAIYVGVLPGQVEVLAPLLRIFFEQVINTLSLKEPDASEPRKVLLMMDEFNKLGEMSAMTSAFTLLAGYNCRVMAVVQGLDWLDTTYGRNMRNGILSCCAHQVFSTNDLETPPIASPAARKPPARYPRSVKYEPPSTNISYRGKPLISKDKAFPKALPKEQRPSSRRARFR